MYIVLCLSFLCNHHELLSLKSNKKKERRRERLRANERASKKDGQNVYRIVFFSVLIVIDEQVLQNKEEEVEEVSK